MKVTDGKTICPHCGQEGILRYRIHHKGESGSIYFVLEVYHYPPSTWHRVGRVTIFTEDGEGRQ